MWLSKTGPATGLANLCTRQVHMFASGADEIAQSCLMHKSHTNLTTVNYSSPPECTTMFVKVKGCLLQYVILERVRLCDRIGPAGPLTC